MSNPKLHQCKGKLSIFTYDHAVAKRNEFKKRMGETLAIYRCKWCGWLHLGHKLNVAIGERHAECKD